MIKKSAKILICFLIFGSFCLPYSFSMSQNQSKVTKMTKQEYDLALANQKRIHFFIQTARENKKNGQYDDALENYLKAYSINQCAGLIAVCRGSLANVYEILGRYEEALQHVDWFMEILSPEESLYKEMTETKTRLLKKTEEQKAWAAKQDPVVAQFKENFPKATDENQKKFLESLGGKGVWDVFKNAMIAEQGQNYAQALLTYESLLPRKAEIEKEMGITGWVMLYPAIQRNSEVLGEKGKEKSALAWIKTNMLDENAEYKEATTKLLPEVVSHLKERIRVYQL